MKFALLLFSGLFLSSGAFASTKYVCSMSHENALGIGFDFEIEVLSDSAANVAAYQTSAASRVPSEVIIENPGVLSREGSILRIQNVVRSVRQPELTAKSTLELNLADLRLTIVDKDDNAPMQIPCSIR